MMIVVTLFELVLVVELLAMLLVLAAILISEVLK